VIGLRAEFAIRVFRPSLRIKCTSVVYWSFFWVDFATSSRVNFTSEFRV